MANKKIWELPSWVPSGDTSNNTIPIDNNFVTQKISLSAITEYVQNNINFVVTANTSYTEIATITYNELNNYLGYSTYYQNLNISGKTPLTSVILSYDIALDNSVWNNNVDFLPRIVNSNDDVIFQSITEFIDVTPNTKIYYNQVKDYIVDLSQLSVKWDFSNSVQGSIVSNSTGQTKIYAILGPDLS